MNTELFIVAIVLITICTLPFYLMSRRAIKKRKNNLKNLSGFAAKNACDVTRSDLWSESAIGIDRFNQMLLYSNNAADPDTFKIVGLIGIRNCSVVTSENADGGIKKLGLRLTFTNNPDVHIEFYNENWHRTLNHELELANKWKDIIGRHVK